MVSRHPNAHKKVSMKHKLIATTDIFSQFSSCNKHSPGRLGRKPQKTMEAVPGCKLSTCFEGMTAECVPRKKINNHSLAKLVGGSLGIVHHSHFATPMACS